MLVALVICTVYLIIQRTNILISVAKPQSANYPVRQATKKTTFLRVKSAHFNALKKNFFCDKKPSWWQLMLLNLFFFKKKVFFNALKCALFTRKNVVFFRYLSAWVAVKWSWNVNTARVGCQSRRKKTSSVGTIKSSLASCRKKPYEYMP